MLTTTLLISFQFKYVKGLPLVCGVLFFLTFGFFDGKSHRSPIVSTFTKMALMSIWLGLFWGASVKKIPEGAWVPLMIGIIL